MPETSTEQPKPNGMTGVLMTLASSGDNWVKLLIVGGLIMNGFLIKREGGATRTDVDKVQENARQQIRTIYKNQNIWATYAQATVEEHRLIMEKLGIPKDQWPRLPPIQFEYLDENNGGEYDR